MKQQMSGFKQMRKAHLKQLRQVSLPLSLSLSLSLSVSLSMSHCPGEHDETTDVWL